MPLEDADFGTSEKINPASGAEAIIPDTPFSKRSRAIYVGLAGNLRMQMVDGQIVTFVSVQAGSVYPFRGVNVTATGTTAGSLVALF